MAFENRSDSDQLRENMKPEDARRRQWILREQRDEARGQRDALLAAAIMAAEVLAREAPLGAYNIEKLALADAIEKATPKGDR